MVVSMQAPLQSARGGVHRGSSDASSPVPSTPAPSEVVASGDAMSFGEVSFVDASVTVASLGDPSVEGASVAVMVPSLLESLEATPSVVEPSVPGEVGPSFCRAGPSVGSGPSSEAASFWVTVPSAVASASGASASPEPAHSPRVHTAPEGHGVAHAPQFSESESSLTQ